MTIRHVIECVVCGSKTLLRTQLGWLREHPIRIPCGRCNIIIHGEVKLFPEIGGFEFTFKNGKELKEDESEFYLECSGELLTKKLQKRADLGNKEDLISPFFKAIWAMGNENYTAFKKQTTQFLEFRENYWQKVSRINLLWLEGKNEYALKEMRQQLNEEYFPLDKELEFLRGVHQLNLIYTTPLRDAALFDIRTKFLWSEFNLLAEKKPTGIIALTNRLNNDGSLKSFSYRFLNVLERLTNIFPNLIPIFSLQFYNSRNSADEIERMGFTTATFEDLKQFYIDCYEDAVEMLVLPLAFNNLKHRGDFDSMRIFRKDVTSLNDFLNLSKGARIQFLDGTEDFDHLIGDALSSNIRNAIGHSSYKFNVENQILTFWPKGKTKAGEEKTMTLVDFAKKCWDIFHAHIILNELSYQTEKVYWITQGQKPLGEDIIKKMQAEG